MPRFVNLKILVTASFDQSSALTLSLGVGGSFFAQVPQRPETRLTKPFPTRVSVADQRPLDSEFRALRTFLANIREIMTDRQIRQWENDHRGRDWRGNPNPDHCRFQIYLWDQISYEHLCRVVGRHLNALLQNDELRNLAWLFPAEELLTNPEHASRASAVTIVENVVRASLAAPIPHHYALMGVARVYHPARIENPAAMFRVHPVFEDKLSDQIPSERGGAADVELGTGLSSEPHYLGRPSVADLRQAQRGHDGAGEGRHARDARPRARGARQERSAHPPPCRPGRRRMRWKSRTCRTCRACRDAGSTGWQRARPTWPFGTARWA